MRKLELGELMSKAVIALSGCLVGLIWHIGLTLLNLLMVDRCLCHTNVSAEALRLTDRESRDWVLLLMILIEVILRLHEDVEHPRRVVVVLQIPAQQANRKFEVHVNLTGVVAFGYMLQLSRLETGNALWQADLDSSLNVYVALSAADVCT